MTKPTKGAEPMQFHELTVDAIMLRTWHCDDLNYPGIYIMLDREKNGKIVSSMILAPNPNFKSLDIFHTLCERICAEHNKNL
jgi:hypothetical protein